MLLALVEDDPKIRQWLKDAILQFGGFEILEAGNLTEAKMCVEKSPDAWVLDIELGRQSIFDWLPADLSEPVIFLTGSREHTLVAFDFGALDYVTKPVQKERLFLALKRIQENVGKARFHNPPKNFKRFFQVKENGTNMWIPVQQVDWIEGADYCCQIHIGEKTWIVQESLKSLQSELDPEAFLRVHRSAIIPISQIKRVIDESFLSMRILLISGQEVPVSRRKRKLVKERLKNLI